MKFQAKVKFVITMTISIALIGCGSENPPEESNSKSQQTTNSQSVGNQEPIDECRDNNDCNFDGAGESTPFLNVDNVQCRESDNGKRCSECLSDEDCPSGHKCSSQIYCVNIQ